MWYCSQSESSQHYTLAAAAAADDDDDVDVDGDNDENATLENGELENAASDSSLIAGSGVRRDTGAISRAPTIVRTRVVNANQRRCRCAICRIAVAINMLLRRLRFWWIALVHVIYERLLPADI